jgi:hypothetical protein
MTKTPRKQRGVFYDLRLKKPTYSFTFVKINLSLPIVYLKSSVDPSNST